MKWNYWYLTSGDDSRGSGPGYWSTIQDHKNFISLWILNYSVLRLGLPRVLEYYSNSRTTRVLVTFYIRLQISISVCSFWRRLMNCWNLCEGWSSTRLAAGHILGNFYNCTISPLYPTSFLPHPFSCLLPPSLPLFSFTLEAGHLKFC